MAPLFAPPDVEISIIICTANRAADLRDTLASLAHARRPEAVALLVVDNRSTDTTRGVVEEMACGYPFPLRYVFEEEEGKYAALNSGIKAARGTIIVATDDDARFEMDWLERAADGLSRYDCDFVGGPVCPGGGGGKPGGVGGKDGG